MELKEALVILLTFLVPLMVYCLVLAVLNRRPHPVVVAGAWDFLGVVLGLSGFLVVGGPAILSNLTTIHAGFRPAEEGEALPVVPRALLLGVVLVTYFVAVIVGIAVALRRRRDVTSVYNVHPAVFDEVFGQVLDQLGLSWARAGNRYYLSARAPQPALSAPEDVAAAAPPPPSGWEASSVVEVEPFPLMQHVTMRWGRLDAGVRQEVEGELTRDLAGVHTRYNPAGGWFLSATTTLFLMIGLLLMLLLASKVLFRV
jgi:hypothetical protein